MQTLLAESNAPNLIEVPALKHTQPASLTVVTPQKYVTSLEDEITLRNVANQLMTNAVIAAAQPALWVSYQLDWEGAWREHIAGWKQTPIVAFIAWSFRGLPETFSAALNDALIHRVMNEMTTIVTCSCDPLLLTPRWESDRAVLSALRKPAMRVRVLNDYDIRVERKVSK